MNWFQQHRIRAKVITITGWILFFYATTHLLNHSLGIFGLDTLESSRLAFLAFWRLPVLEWLVVGCLLLHFLFVLHKLFMKSTYRGLSRMEWVQIVLGLLIPDILGHHIMETKIAHELFGLVDSYSYYIYWTPGYYWVLFLLTISVVWIHGAIGIRQYIKQKTWFTTWRMWLLGGAVALPVIAICGVVTAIRDVNRLSQDPDWIAKLLASNNPSGFDIFHWTESYSYWFSGLYILFIILFFSARKLTLFIKRKHKGVLIKYLEGTEIRIPRGTTLLEASLLANIPHAHVCGGRGRCSTCRVQIIEGLEFLPPPTKDEEELLQKIGSEKGVRLACRTMPETSCTIYPLLLPNVTLKQTLWKKTQYTGMDRDVAILFSDLRGFTAMAEDKLPYDVVFVLNQYFQFMGHAIETHHGRIDKFIGDAIMAVFGVDRDPKQACRDALAAARSMRFQLDRLNNQLKDELPDPLQMGFGIHFGHVIIGNMGYKDANNLVAIGDATNIASRLESLTKDYNCEMIISRAAMECAQLQINGFEPHQVRLKGRQKLLEVYTVSDVKALEI